LEYESCGGQSIIIENDAGAGGTTPTGRVARATADFACIALGAVVTQIQGGTIKAIAIASPERTEVIKDVPTTKEGGLADFQVTAWNALFAPRNLQRGTCVRI